MSPKRKFINHIKQVKKRNGDIISFDRKKIEEVLYKALTATNEGGKVLSRQLCVGVIKILNRRFKKDEIPDVEQIQDVVEEILILENLVETSKAYILYRAQRKNLRESRIVTGEAISLVDEYLKEKDWEVKENSNMAFSLQGLNHYVSAYVAKKYWLRKIYPPEVREAAESGDFHIHNLDILATYCCGWDLYDLLLRGFGGVFGKVQSKPPKHFRSALGQVVNFFYTLQGEIAGAVAFSNFDTLLAPFIRYDNLEYKQVKQAMQEFLFGCAVPTRVGFQCLSQDTQILSPDGWKSHSEVKEGDAIYTFNLQTKQIEQKNVSFIFRKDYQGLMYNLKNRSQDQLISPNHRVVRQAFNAEHYVLEPIEKILELKSPIAVPVRADNINSDFPVTDEQLKLLAWTLSEGTIEKDGSHRVSIYQSQSNKENYQEIIGLLDHFNFDYSQREQVSLGTCMHIRLKPLSSRVIHSWIESTRKKMPDFIYKLSQRQARLFLDVFVKADGWVEKYRQRITTTDENFLRGLEALAVLAGYNFSVMQRMPHEGGIGKKLQHILTLTETQNDYIMQINKVDYQGVIWSVHTDNETVIAKRNGQVFITGNTPFSNITIDIKPSLSYAKQPVIIGGELQKETYGEFGEEMKVFNKAFFEAMLEGDKNGRIFTFPIPTVNITKDFPWDDEFLEPMWLATAKYGINYFANFIQSDMKPEDVRSMCCRLRLNNKELLKRGGGLFGANPLTGSQGVVTINMSRLGYLSKTKKEFFERLERVMDLAKESLEIKRTTVEDFMKKGLYPYSRYYLETVEKMRGNYYGNHFSTIGILGMNECLLNFTGEDIGSDEGRKFTLEVMDFMREVIIKYQEETGNLYNLESTPAEGASYRLALKDREKYPEIITAGTKETPYYTNSTQLPVNYTDDAFKAVELQDEIQCKYTGGVVLHLFIGEQLRDIASMKNLIKKIFSNNKLPYITITPTFSVCPSHGYLSGEHWKCPKCTIEQPCEVYSRVVGYIRPIQQWHKGKAQEFKERVPFNAQPS